MSISKEIKIHHKLFALILLPSHPTWSLEKGHSYWDQE